jgi:hypothetical protein
LLDSTDATADVHSSMHEPPPFQVDGSGSAYPGRSGSCSSMFTMYSQQGQLVVAQLHQS